jgi:hypothetical protein
MQLVRIENIRCAEWDSNTWILAPDEWDEDKIQEQVDKAMDAYIDTLDKLRENKKGKPFPNLRYAPDYKAHPERTVREIDEEYDRKKIANQEWEKEHKDRNLGFENFLMNQGFFSLYDDEADSFIVEASANWGHRHGTRINYNETRNEHITPQSVVDKERGIDSEPRFI